MPKYLMIIKNAIAKFTRLEIRYLGNKNQGCASYPNSLVQRQKIATRQWYMKCWPPLVLPVQYPYLATYMTLIIKYALIGELLKGGNKASKTYRKTCFYSLLEDRLYHRGFTKPLLKYLAEEKGRGILEEIHQGPFDRQQGGMSGK